MFFYILLKALAKIAIRQEKEGVNTGKETNLSFVGDMIY